MRQFDTILWDVDDTLLDFHRSEVYALRNAFQHFSIDLTEEMSEKYQEINHGLWRQLEQGEVTNRDVLVGRFESLFDGYGITHVSGEDMQNYYSDALGSVFFLLDHGDDVCRLLSENYRQYIVTNGAVVTQMKKLKLSGLDEYMEDIFISEEIGYSKPAIEFFNACFQKIPGFDREKTLIVGDSLMSDMKGGINAGIATCWYNAKHMENKEKLPVDYEIHRLEELIDLLNR